MISIRVAEQADLPALLQIYNEEVLHGTATFDLHPKTLAERQVWFDQHNQDNHPLLTAELDGMIAGYASLSVYVAKFAQRKGVASALMQEILAIAQIDVRIHSVVSIITGGNAASERLHEKFGFQRCGMLKEMGKKFGRYLDVVYYQLLV